MDTGRPTWRSRTWLAAAGVLLVLACILSVTGAEPPEAAWVTVLAAVGIAVTVTMWALLSARAQRRRYEEELAEWAGERAAQAERLRIASDLHDLVSHGLGLITVRAAVARTLAGPGGERERADALIDIERVSRGTTTELRRMLAVLRDPGAAPLRPADSLDDLPRIVADANTAGLEALLDVEPLGDVSSGAQLTVCAVVREGLSNALRHAGPTHARVQVRRRGETIVVSIEDAGPIGPWQSRPGAGHGLDGLRERVTALGGALHAEPRDRGFRVTARFADTERP